MNRSESKAVPPIAPPPQQIDIEWNDLSYSVNGRGGANAQPVLLLSHCSGYCRAGSMLAIMGASGAGKTTLLNCLSGRRMTHAGARLSGAVQFTASERSAEFGAGKSGREWEKLIAFVYQTDLFFETLTAREHLMYQSRLRLPESYTDAERAARVDGVLSDLGLDKCADTRIGDPTAGGGGLSGGERRRLSVAAELISNPSLLFCDEPTTGLDSFMAETVIERLRDLAHGRGSGAAGGRTIICTIHSPNSDVFKQFDLLCLMNAGRVAYFGPRDAAVAYFSRLNFVCPQFWNPADYFVSILSSSSASTATRSAAAAAPGGATELAGTQQLFLLDAWAQQTRTQPLPSPSGGISPSVESDFDFSLEAATAASAYRSGWIAQYRTNLDRAVASMARDPALLRVRVMQAVLVGLLFGLSFLQIGTSGAGSVQNRLGVIYGLLLNAAATAVGGVFQAFTAELDIINRENLSRLTCATAYFASKTVADLPAQLLTPVFAGTLTYYMAGLDASNDTSTEAAAVQFFTFIGILALCCLCSISIGVLVSTVAPSVQAGLAIIPLTLMLCVLFGGYYLNADSFPVYFVWISSISFYRYGFEALTVTTFRDLTITCDAAAAATNGGCAFATGRDVIRYYSFDVDSVPRNAAILCALAVGFRALACIALYAKFARSRVTAFDTGRGTYRFRFHGAGFVASAMAATVKPPMAIELVLAPPPLLLSPPTKARRTPAAIQIAIATTDHDTTLQSSQF